MQFVRLLPNGRVLTLVEVTGGKARLCVSRSLVSGYYDDEWIYDSTAVALKAAHAWDPESQPEPEGWLSNPTTRRQRPMGDKSREFVSGGTVPPPSSAKPKPLQE